MHAHNTSANITQSLAGAVLLCCFSPQVRGQTGAQTQTFVIHGTPKTCSAITQLDSALSADSQQFFAGWTERDYLDAVAWSQACSEYGWHVSGRPRIPLLLAQHDRALGSAQTQIVSSTVTAGALPSPPVQAAVAVPAQAVPSVATDSALPSPPVQAAVAAPARTEPSAVVQTAVAEPAQAVPSTATGSVVPSLPVQAAVAAPVQAIPSAATDSVLPSPSVQAALAAPAQAVPIAATGSVLPNSPVQSTVAAPAQAVSSSTPGRALPNSHVRDRTVSDGEEDSVLSDNFLKEHFHQESLWVANKANLDIGDDRAPSSWSSSGIPAQMKNRLTADRIVLYCARKTNSGESGKRPLLWDLRWCEAEEASAYNRLVSGNEFPTAGRGIVLGCADVDSYIYLERCMATLTDAGTH